MKRVIEGLRRYFTAEPVIETELPKQTPFLDVLENALRQSGLFDSEEGVHNFLNFYKEAFDKHEISHSSNWKSDGLYNFLFRVWNHFQDGAFPESFSRGSIVADEAVEFNHMYGTLVSDGYTDDQVELLFDQCSLDTASSFVNDFLHKGREFLKESLEKTESQKFKVAAGAAVWSGNDVGTWTLDEYFNRLKDTSASSGRLLVHITRDNLIGTIIANGKLTPSALLHLKGEKDTSYNEISNELGKNRDSGDGRQTRGVSLGVHFSFDDSPAYLKGEFAVVAGAEALCNNYGFSDLTNEADVVVGGTTNDFEDTSHEIDVQKYGFFLVPEGYKSQMREQESASRIFFYRGTLAEGLLQIREKLGPSQRRIKAPHPIEMCRYFGDRVPISANSPDEVKRILDKPTAEAAELARSGREYYPSNDFTFSNREHLGGAGCWYRVKRSGNEEQKDDSSQVRVTLEQLKLLCQEGVYAPELFLKPFEEAFPDVYKESVGVREGYTLKEHTEMVLRQFEKYFSSRELPANTDIVFFRILLALHDIGKPEAVKKGSKDLQHTITQDYIEDVMEALGLQEPQIHIALALLSADPIGKCIQQELPFEKAVYRIRCMSRQAGMPALDFFDLLCLLYTVDASSYTEDAGGKKALDTLFIFNPDQRRVDFVPEVQSQIDELRQEIERQEARR